MKNGNGDWNNDAGCIRYELLQDVKDPHLLTILEE